jgi:hypothetical protein
VYENSPAVGIMLILVGGFALGVPSAIVFTPPLPRVKLEMNEESAAGKKIGNPCQGWLVAHSDGFWHLLLEESGELQSIPDERVLLARTGGKGHTPPANKAASTEGATPEDEAKPGEENAK